MGKDRTDILFATASEYLSNAEHERERAEEDVVTHLICHHSRLALANYLAGFLIRREFPVHHPVTLAGLLEQCKSLDARFEVIDLSHVHCRFETQDFKFCLDLPQVDTCIKVAQQTRDIIMTETPAY